jgi:hypothetical protein
LRGSRARAVSVVKKACCPLMVISFSQLRDVGRPL